MKESYKELQDRFTQKYNELYYPEGFTEENNPKSFWEIIDSLHAGVNYARNCMEFYLKENRSEDDFTLCEYYAKVLDTYLRTKAELNLGILFVSDCDVRKTWSERNPMIVENSDDYTFTKNDINNFPPSNSNNTIHCDDHTTICQKVIKPNSNWKEEFEKHKDLFPAPDSNLKPLYIDPYESLEWTLKGSISWCKVTRYPMEKTLQFLINDLQSRLKTLQK